MRFSLVVIVLAATGLLAADLRPPTAPRNASAAPFRELALAERPPRPSVVEIAFVRNGWVARVERELPRRVDPARFALRELLAGPTPAERRAGIRTAIPGQARVRSIRSEDDAWHVSVTRSMVDGGTADARRMRIWQIAATLEPLGEERRLVLATAGRFLTVQRLGVVPGALGADAGEQGYRYSVDGVQRQLALLGYLSPGGVTGTLDYATEQALLAFQGWEDLARTGTVTGQTQLALFGASRPEAARTARDGRRVEIHRDLGVLLLVEDGEVVRSVHTSTGAAGATPVGTFRVYLKSLLSWSVPFEVWMPYASYFRGGIAMHESPDVPSYPASHGCVRLPDGDAERVYRFVEIGTPVSVF